MTKNKETGYEYIDDNGKILAIEKATGETCETITVTLPMGSIAYTPQQQRAYKERKLFEAIGNAGTAYIFANAGHWYHDISPATMGRLIFLTTFISYDEQTLYKTQRLKMSKDDLPAILRLPKTTAMRFWKEVKDKYIIEDKSGNLTVSPLFFIRGHIPQTQKGSEWQKAYIDLVRALYAKTPITSHRYLGYIFQMLPFLNTEYNMLCHNPKETGLEKITPITLDEFCLLCGYATAEKKKRLLRIYKDIKFEIGNHEEYFCSFVTSDIDNIGTSKIFVNPNIIYKGHKWDEVKILGQFCK